MPAESYCLFLMLDPFRQNSERVCGRVPSWEREDRYLIGAEAFYHPARDSLVVSLCFQPELGRALGGPGMEALLRSCPVPMIASPDLGGADRQNFLNRLSTYPYYIQLYAARGEQRNIVARSIDSVVDCARQARGSTTFATRG